MNVWPKLKYYTKKKTNFKYFFSFIHFGKVSSFSGVALDGGIISVKESNSLLIKPRHVDRLCNPFLCYLLPFFSVSHWVVYNFFFPFSGLCTPPLSIKIQKKQFVIFIYSCFEYNCYKYKNLYKNNFTNCYIIINILKPIFINKTNL